ncbi:MAG: tetratricopeptide repeat protein [Spirochaetia bacterium]|nr:tetratricopeptide repeat protein [Spirochaetia bacterium]
MKKTIIAAAFIMFASLSYAAFYANMVEEDSYIDAVEAMEKKDYEGARKAFSSFNEKFKESKYRPTVLLRLAELSPDTDSAVRYYNEVEKNFPDSEYEAEAVFSLGRLYYATDDTSAAKKYFNIIMQKYSGMVWVEEAYYYMILCALKEKNYKEAEKVYDAYTAAQKYFIFKNRMTLAYADSLFDTGRYKDAAVKYREVIEKYEAGDKNIYMPHVYFRLAEACRRDGDQNGAANAESDLKFKFPESSEAQGQESAITAANTPVPAKTQKPAATAVATQAAANTSAGGTFYTIQIGAYTNKVFAAKLIAKFREDKYNVFTKDEGKFLKIYIGRFATKEEADAYAVKFAGKEKITNYLVKQGWE